jgi:hypothetical protein
VSAGTQATATAHGEHVVHFYEHDAELVGAVCPYLADALGSGETAIVIATAEHRRAFEAELEARDIDVDRAGADGLLFSLDADATLEAFSDDGHIDHRAFHAVVGVLLRNALASGRPVRAYGEMVALLWDRGDVLAAIELEGLWNELGRELSFSLLCSYPSASVVGSEHAHALERVCGEHSAVLERTPARRAGHSVRSGEHYARSEPSVPSRVRATFPAERDSPAHARRMAAATLRRWGCEDALIDDVSLVVSELASNAVRHAGSAFSLALQMQGPLLRVTVADRASLPDTGLTPCSPHGLCVVDSLSTGWGVEPAPQGKVVWAELTRDAPLA